MWYKVKDLYENQGLNKSQIAKELGVDRGTVRRYLSMDEKSFHQWISWPKHMPHKLNRYYGFVKDALERRPFLSAAQIEDRLRENCTDLPEVHPKTVYNFVTMIRQREGIKKYKTEKMRDYERLPEPKYGSEGQVDFGEFTMKDVQDKHHKVYFFTMVLSRSRYKFVYFQYRPFTSSTAIDAHLKAFEFFRGLPEKILYDQDRVFMRDENLGDWLLTEEFSRFCQDQPFSPVFCRKVDPESKGKIENVVGYIKKNFLRGRVFHNIDLLNQQALKWLDRTGNNKRHGTTWKIPMEEWKIEKAYLKRLKTPSGLPHNHLKQHKVHKDNKIIYKGNQYSVPTGTYQGPETYVVVQFQDSQMIIFGKDGQVIARHQISCLKGEFVENNDHRRDKSTTIEKKEEQALALLGGGSQAEHFLKAVHKDKPRHYNDHLRVIIDHLGSSKQEHLLQGLSYCIEHGLYNSNRLKEAVAYYRRQDNNRQQVPVSEKVALPDKANIKPEKTNLDQYESIMR